MNRRRRDGFVQPAMGCVCIATLLACSPAPPEETGPASADEVQAEAWLAEMTLDEKIAQMHGASILASGGLWRTADLPRLDIPGFAMSDGPRGLTATTATTFPVPMARGATFDVDLEREVGAVIGAEAHAFGANVLLAPCVNLLNHPAWGRAQETYGEDPALLARMGVAFVSGAQQHIATSVKHLALNNIELSRFDVDVTASPALLHDVYLPAFEAVVKEAGVASVMTAYNSVNGAYCSENAPLLTDILRDLWGFQGFVESDWVWGTHNTVPAVEAGLDVEMPIPMIYGPMLRDAVDTGEVAVATIDDAVRRILRTKAAFNMHDPAPRDPSILNSAAHDALALRAAQESLVLLKNDETQGAFALPLGEEVTRVAVLGALAGLENLGDTGSSASYPVATVTPLAGIESLAASRGVTVDAFPEDVVDEAWLQTIADADAAIVVVGLTAEDEGEYIPVYPGGADRESLRVSDTHLALIAATRAVQPRTIVLVEGGSAVVVDPWIDDVPAAMMIWYPGQAGGTAVAQTLWGEVNPSGKLPLTIPTDASQLPPFDNESLAVTYPDLHGYWHVEATGATPRYAFGHGLSYTQFALADLSLPAATDAATESITATVNVSNTGERRGAQVVQVYAGPASPAANQPARRLVGFARVELDPGAQQTVEVPLDLTQLYTWDAATRRRRFAAGTYRFWAGDASDNLTLEATLGVE